MKVLKVRDLKRARKKIMKELHEPKLDVEFKENLDKIQDALLKGLPRYTYELKPGQVNKHLSFWLRHPIWNKLTNSPVVVEHTKTRVMMVISFNG